MRVPGVDQAIANLVRWSASETWAPYRDHVFAEHIDTVCDRLDMTEEDLADLLDESVDMLDGIVLEDFFTARFGEDGELNVIDDYLKRRGWREKVPARRYLEAMRDSVLSLYEVVDLVPGHSMTVRDLIRGGDPVTVEEKLGSESAARWDRIAGRVVIVNNKPYFTGGLLLLPPEVANDVLSAFDDMSKRLRAKLRREARKEGTPMEIEERDMREMILDTAAPQMFTEAWLVYALDRASAPMQEIRNTDGDVILYSEVRFPLVADRAEVAAALDRIETFERDATGKLSWSWLGSGSFSQRMSRNQTKDLTPGTEDATGRTSLGHAEIADDVLILSTNSRERAERGCALLCSRLGTQVGTPLTSHQDVEKMLQERPAATAPQADLPPEVAEEVIHAFLDDHYRRTLDDPVPALDGRTPRQAAKTKKGRAQVTDWLKRLENSEHRRAASQGQKPYDTAWIWRELKLEGSR